MKKLLLLFGAGLFTVTSLSQTTVSNAGFEAWGNTVVKDSLDYWFTSSVEYQNQGIIDVNNASSMPGYSSPKSLRLETILRYDPWTAMDDTIFAYAANMGVNGSDFLGFPYTDTVDVFNCWYKSGILAGDQGLIIVELSKNGVAYSSTVYPIIGSQSSWTMLSIPLLDGNTEEPDSVFVGFTSSDPFTPGVAKPGSWLQVDAISFDFTGGSPNAAIPNGDFENWTTETIEEASNWWSFDPSTYYATQQVYVSQSAIASQGSYAMQVETTFENLMLTIPTFATNGYYDFVNDTLVGGSPFNAQPDQFIGDYQFSSVMADTAWVYVDFWNSTSGLHVVGIDTLGDAATWTPFSIDLTFTEAPDSVLIVFIGGQTLGASLLVDDLQFIGGDVSIPVIATLQAGLMVYPNPANNNATVLFSAADKITVYDMNGRAVTEINSPAGNKIELGTAEWENGIYMVQLINDGKTETRKLSVQH